jgi:hypothetical protein
MICKKRRGQADSVGLPSEFELTVTSDATRKNLIRYEKRTTSAWAVYHIELKTVKKTSHAVSEIQKFKTLLVNFNIRRG